MHMNKAVQISLLIGLSLVGSAMARKKEEPPPEYTPTRSMSVEEAKKLIYRCLEEQPGSYTVSDIEFAPVKMSYVRYKRGKGIGIAGVGGGSVSSHHQRTVFYYDSLGSMDRTLHSKGWVVRVLSDGFVSFQVVIQDAERSKRFMDAMLVMSPEE